MISLFVTYMRFYHWRKWSQFENNCLRLLNKFRTIFHLWSWTTRKYNLTHFFFYSVLLKKKKLVWIYLFLINHFESRRLPDWATSSEMAIVKNSVLLNFELIITLFLGQLIFKVIPKVTISKIKNLITLTFQKYPNPTNFFVP